jgi:hypothetical protein
MKSCASVILAVAVLTLLKASTVQAQSGGLNAVVPFEFTIGTTTLPAGSYSLTCEFESGGRVIVHSLTRSIGSRQTLGLADDQPAKPIRLVFHHYGKRYFLRQVWFASTLGRRGYALPETQEERLLIEATRVADLAGRAVTLLAQPKQ